MECFPSGCALLDCVLGGGYAETRIINIVGDKSTGKTLLAIEACANFVEKYGKNARVYYNEVEAAFDRSYASSLGLPLASVDFCEGMQDFTADGLFEHLSAVIESHKTDERVLYIVDSLDALSDRDEMDRKIDEASYGAGKARKMSQLFRRLIKSLSSSNVTIIIVSQVRDNIGVAFGKNYSRSGGRALDFYASQVIYLAHKGYLKRTRKGIERAYGINVKAKCEKNKVGTPFRDCEFPIIFGFGIDDVAAGVEWLRSVKRLDAVGFKDEKEVKKYIRSLDSMTSKEYDEERVNVKSAVVEVWDEIEIEFAPKKEKYGIHDNSDGKKI